jgi:hypothetical protein
MVMTRLPRFQRLLPVFIGILILVVIGLLPVSLPTQDDTNTQVIPQGEGGDAAPPRPVGEIFAGVTVAQEFPATGTEISAAALLLATYQRINSGTIQVMLQTQANDQWQTLGSETVEKTALRDTMLYSVEFDPPLVVKRGQLMRIVLQADGNKQNAITWWTNPSFQRPGFALFLNGDPQPGVAEFHISYARASGRLMEMIDPLWARMTVFLDPLWRAILAVGILVLLSSFFVLGRYLSDRAAVPSHERVSPAPPQDSEERVLALAGEEHGGMQPDHQNGDHVLPDLADRGVDR